MTSLQDPQLQLTNWRQFDSILRSSGTPLLKRLDEFPNSVLVTGCQRSGTTMLARIISHSVGMVNYGFGSYEELDAALILSGYVDHVPRGRYCFQTTYLNDAYREYYEHSSGHKIIWILRNPYSVVQSLVYNWNALALDTLYERCGASQFSGASRWIDVGLGIRGMGRLAHDLLDVPSVRRLFRACCSYRGKTSQAIEMASRPESGSVFLVDYDELVEEPEVVLPAIYRFIELEYRQGYCSQINRTSLSKASALTRGEARLVKFVCAPVYLEARRLLTLV